MASNPYVNKVVCGNTTVLDLTSDTVTSGDVTEGVTFHNAAGASTTGSMKEVSRSTESAADTDAYLELNTTDTTSVYEIESIDVESASQSKGYLNSGRYMCAYINGMDARPEDVAAGKTFIGYYGAQQTGTNTGGITPTGTISITENGTFDVTQYANADVNVSGGGGIDISDGDVIIGLGFSDFYLKRTNNSYAGLIQSTSSVRDYFKLMDGFTADIYVYNSYFNARTFRVSLGDVIDFKQVSYDIVNAPPNAVTKYSFPINRLERVGTSIYASIEAPSISADVEVDFKFLVVLKYADPGRVNINFKLKVSGDLVDTVTKEIVGPSGDSFTESIRTTKVYQDSVYSFSGSYTGVYPSPGETTTVDVDVEGEEVEVPVITFTGTWTESEDARIPEAFYEHRSAAIRDSEYTIGRMTFSGLSSITVSCVSEAESNYDYAMVMPLDTACQTSISDEPLAVITTKGKQKQILDYTYTVPDSGEHYIEFKYRKDTSSSTQPDCAWVGVTGWVKAPSQAPARKLMKSASKSVSKSLSASTPVEERQWTGTSEPDIEEMRLKLEEYSNIINSQ